MTNTVLEAQQSLAVLLPQSCAEILLIWDIIITFDQEVELIWKAPRSIVKCLFLFIRYAALSTILVELIGSMGLFKAKVNICLISFGWEDVVSSIILLAVDLFLLYRVYAFYGNRKILYILLALWIANIGAISALATLVYLSYPATATHVTTDRLPGVLPECLSSSFPKFVSQIWICELIFHSILFFLIMFKFMKQEISVWHRERSISGVYLVFIRDGIWAYVVLFAIFLGTAVEHSLSGLSWILWNVPLVSIVATRLILNLKDVGSSEQVPITQARSLETLTYTSTYIPQRIRRVHVVFDTIDQPEDEDESKWTSGGRDVIELAEFRRE